MIRVVFSVMCVVLTLGCATTGQPDPVGGMSANALNGEWLLAMPAGFERLVRIEVLDQAHVALATGGNLTGKYELRGRRLVIVDPPDSRKEGTAWTIVQPDKLVLSRSPTGMGSDYTGATLTR